MIIHSAWKKDLRRNSPTPHLDVRDSAMKVQVNMYANLRQYAPGGAASFTLNMACGSTLINLIDTLNIPQGVNMVVLINGRRADVKTQLSPEDKLTLFPPMEGG